MEVEKDKLYGWVDSYQFSRKKRNIHRDFSDAVNLAEILKRHFPKLVELHNYVPKNSYAHKVENWRTLQWKVLSKLGIHLTKATIDALSRAVPGAIERVLAQVKSILDRKNKDNVVYFMEDFDVNEAECKGDIVPFKIKLGSKTSDKKMVSSQIFEDMLKSITKKDDINGNLRIKV